MNSVRAPQAHCLTVLHLKGGVGKTHATWLLASVCQERERRVLLLDTDTQGNLSNSFVSEEEHQPGVEALFHPANDTDVHGLIRRTAAGVLLPVSKSVRTSDDIVDLSLRKCYEENLDLAKNALNEREIDERDFSTITMAIDPAKMSIAKERIRRFQDELSDLMETGNRSEVYRLSMQLFPLTQKRKEV